MFFSNSAATIKERTDAFDAILAAVIAEVGPDDATVASFLGLERGAVIVKNLRGEHKARLVAVNADDVAEATPGRRLTEPRESLYQTPAGEAPEEGPKGDGEPALDLCNGGGAVPGPSADRFEFKSDGIAPGEAGERVGEDSSAVEREEVEGSGEIAGEQGPPGEQVLAGAIYLVQI